MEGVISKMFNAKQNLLLGKKYSGEKVTIEFGIFVKGILNQVIVLAPSSMYHHSK